METAARTKDEERQSYLEGYEKAAAAARTRLTELEALGHGDGDKLYDDAKQALEDALGHLKAYGGKGQEKAQKRPAQSREKRA